MSLSVDGFWKAGFWSQTFWADGFWFEGAVAPPAVTNDGGAHHPQYDISDPRHPYWQRRIEVEDEPEPVVATPPAPRAAPKPATEVATALFLDALKRAIGTDAPAQIPIPDEPAIDMAAALKQARQADHRARETALLEAYLLAELID